MPLTRFLQNTAFGPEEVALLVAAYEAALGELDLSGRSDPVTQIVAMKIIELAKEGERDPERLREGKVVKVVVFVVNYGVPVHIRMFVQPGEHLFATRLRGHVRSD